MSNHISINIGDTFTSNEGYEFFIIGRTRQGGGYISNEYIIRFNDEAAHVKTAERTPIIKGQIKNPFHPSVYDRGYMGDGSYKGSRTVDGVQKKTSEYEAWRGMLKRSYCPKTQERQPTYIGCSVHPDWHNFQTFAKWYTSQVGYVEGWDMDKDLLVEGNKVYGPDTCILLPRPINSLLSMANMITGRFLPRGIHKHGTGYRVEVASLADKRVTKTYRTQEEAIKVRNKNTIERIDEIVDVYSDTIPEHVMSIIKKRLYKLLWIPSEEDSTSN